MTAKEKEPTPIGCFKDLWKRDLRNFLGYDLTIEECIIKGKEINDIYVGLQHGNECWADSTIGGYGKADDNDCKMPCSRDHSKFCGGPYRNLVFDLRDLHRGS